ncbi:MAG: hypothetical protein P8Y79_14270 [Ignavibacteriaceae bacterium]
MQVGVNQGDWIEYEVNFSGNVSLGHDAVWAKLVVTNVSAYEISINTTVMETDGSLNNNTFTIDLEKGDLIDDFIIPANLELGDEFYDKNQGNLSILEVENKTIAGVQRTIITTTTNVTTYNWDQETGILIKANSTYPGYSIMTKANATNMWKPEILGLNSTVFVGFFTLLLLFIVILIVIISVAKRTIGN